MVNNRQLKISAATVVLGLAVVIGGSAHAAATPEELGLSPQLIEQARARLLSPSAAPSVAFGSPIGFGTGYGEFFAGIGGETLPDNAQDSVDGSIGLGLGIGDPFKWVALEVTSSIISITDDFGHDGNLNFKLHHALPNKLGVAIGVYNTGRWGDAKATTSSTYAAISRPFDISSQSGAMPITMTLNAGIGEGRFGKPGTVADPGSNVGGFGSAAFTFARRFSVIGDYTGRDFNAGVSLLPFAHIPLVITAGLINLGERYGVETQFAGGFSYTFRL